VSVANPCSILDANETEVTLERSGSEPESMSTFQNSRYYKVESTEESHL